MTAEERRRLEEMEDKMNRIQPLVYRHQEQLDSRLFNALAFEPRAKGFNKWDWLIVAAACGLLIASYFID